MNIKLSTTQFILSQIVILMVGLLFVGSLYYIVSSPTLPGQSKISTLELGGPVTKEPASLTFDLTSPDDDSLVFNKDLEISGKTSPKSQILVSSDASDQVIQSKADGTFSMDFNLDPGVNELRIIVFDKNGDQKEASRTVYYSKEKL